MQCVVWIYELGNILEQDGSSPAHASWSGCLHPCSTATITYRLTHTLTRSPQAEELLSEEAQEHTAVGDLRSQLAQLQAQIDEASTVSAKPSAPWLAPLGDTHGLACW